VSGPDSAGPDSAAGAGAHDPVGRELGLEALASYTEVKNVFIATEP